MTVQQVDIIYPPTKNKGKGGIKGAPCGHQKPRNAYNGLFFLHGTGCSKWDDCLTCPLKKCSGKPKGVKPTIKEEGKSTIISATKTETPNWKLRACPRCHGDMYLSADIYTDESDENYSCLQCGFRNLSYRPLKFTRAKWLGKPPEEVQGNGED